MSKKEWPTWSDTITVPKNKTKKTRKNRNIKQISNLPHPKWWYFFVLSPSTSVQYFSAKHFWQASCFLKIISWAFFSAALGSLSKNNMKIKSSFKKLALKYLKDQLRNLHYNYWLRPILWNLFCSNLLTEIFPLKVH